MSRKCSVSSANLILSERVQRCVQHLVLLCLALGTAEDVHGITNGTVLPSNVAERTGFVKLEVVDHNPRRAVDRELWRYVSGNATYNGAPIQSCYSPSIWSQCTGAPAPYANRGDESCTGTAAAGSGSDPNCSQPILDKCIADLRASEDFVCASAAVNPNIEEGNCTGAIISSSSLTNETWILTAAHCFYSVGPLYTLNSPIKHPQARVIGPLNKFVANPSESTVFIHPDWKTDPDWFDPPDLALVKVKRHVNVYDSTGGILKEFRRTILTGSSDYLRWTVDNLKGIYNRSVACGVHHWVSCGRAKNLTSDGRYVVVNGSDWLGGAVYEPGDSGGPHLVLREELGTPEGISHFPEHGILVGVVSGPAVGTSLSWAKPCPCDYYAASTYSIRQWVDQTVGTGVIRFINTPQQVNAVAAVDIDADGLPELMTAFDKAGIYLSPDGTNPGGGGSSARVYPGPAKLDTLTPFQRGVIAAFYNEQTGQSWGIYRSPDGQNVGGGGQTTVEYGGAARVEAMTIHKGSVLTAFYNVNTGQPWGVYLSPDGKHLGGGGNTKHAYAGQGRVDSLVSYAGGVITAFYNPSNKNSWGIYASPDAINLGGGGATQNVYSGQARVEKMIAYKSGVVTAFYNPHAGSSWGVYYSPDARNLGGGGSTKAVYTGSARVEHMIALNGGVLTAFYNPGSKSGWGIYFSPDGQNLGGGGATVKVYGGKKRVLALLPFRGGVVAAFEAGDIYFSPDGSNLHGGGATTRMYPVATP